MSWEKTTIGEHCTVTSSKRFHLSDRSNSGVPFYCSKEIIQKVKSEKIDSCDYISEEFYEEVARKYGVPQENDLLVTTRGTIGIPYLYKKSDRFYFADGNLTWMKDFRSTLLPQYLYYWFLSHEGQRKIDSIAKGTAQKAVPIAGIKTLEMLLPPIETQRRIADILSTYDDLIENNRKQIKLLEEAAQRLYKEWFVDLHFPGHEHTKIMDGVPEGWERAHLSDIADINANNIPKNYCFNYIEYTDLSAVQNGIIREKTRYALNEAPGRAKRMANDGDIIWGMVRPNLKSFALVLHPTETDVFSTGFCVLSAKKVPFTYLYYAVTTESFIKYLVNCTNGAAYPAVKPIHFSEAEIILPHEKILKRFNIVVEPMLRKRERLLLIINQASQARDRLLPKLMSGEVEV